MISRFQTFSGRSVLAMTVMVIAVILFQGCGQDGNDHGDDADHDDTDAVADDGRSGSEANDDGHEADEHGGAVEFTEPHTYAEAIHAIHEQLEKIDSLIESRTLDRVHAEAAVIRDVAGSLAKLALHQDSGIPRDAIKEINLAARDLAATFGPIDEAGDSGDLAGTQKVYDEMIELFETLEQYADHDEDDGQGEHDDG